MNRPNPLILVAIHWSGNIRERKNGMKNVSLFIDGPLVTTQVLAQHSKIDEAQTEPEVKKFWAGSEQESRIG